MAKVKPSDVVTKIVDLLTPLAPEDRTRVISASLTLLGEAPTHRTVTGVAAADNSSTAEQESAATNIKARVWLRQNQISNEQLASGFHSSDGKTEVIVADIPGKNNKEKTLNAYVLTGIAKLLENGEPKFTDKEARSVCTSAGCYDRPNHATILKGKGNWFTGSKEKGWVLTAPGLKPYFPHMTEVISG